MQTSCNGFIENRLINIYLINIYLINNNIDLILLIIY